MARRRSKQSQYQRQYRELLYNAHQIYNDLTLALRLHEDTPSFERVLREAGTRTGLTKPTKKSIQALKTLQTRSGILNKVMWATKGEAHEEAKEMFEAAWKNEKEHKERKRNEKKYLRELDKLKKEIAEGEWTPEELQELKTTIELKEAQYEDLVKDSDVTDLEELKREAQIIVDKMRSAKYMSQFEESIAMKAASIVEIINEILGSNNAQTISRGAEAARRITREHGTLTIEELYNEGDKISGELMDALYDDVEFNQDLPEGWAS